jgi:catechol 2,3-dioxygenase-like lactoylglutathione lyase family enzyme
VTSGVHHVLVLASDMDATRDFYRDAIGLSEGPRPPLEFPGHWLYDDDGSPCLHVADRAAYAAHARTLGLVVAASPGGPGPIDHIALSGSDHDAAVARLERHGVAFLRNVIPGAGIRQLFVEDPDGVRVELNLPPA